MIAVLGLALMGASVMLLFYVARRRNGPNPPRWSRWGVTVHTTLITFLCGTLFGSSLVLLPFFQKTGPGFGMPEFGLSAIVAAVTVVLWKAINRLPKPVEPANSDVPVSAAKAGVSRRRAA